MKRICIGKRSNTPFYSYCRGWNGIKQVEMIDYIRSTSKTVYYYVIANDNLLAGR